MYKRSKWKTVYTEKIKKVNKILSLNTTILPQHVNLKIKLYVGNIYKYINITQNMIGFKIGEYFFTRKKKL